MTKHLDIEVRQGETFSLTYTYLDSAGDPVDLTGYSARMRVGYRYGGIGEAYLSTGSDAQGGTLTLGDAAGTVEIAFTATQASSLAGNLSELLVFEPQKYRGERFVPFQYDLEIESAGGTVTRLLEGRLIVQRGMTE